MVHFQWIRCMVVLCRSSKTIEFPQDWRVVQEKQEKPHLSTDLRWVRPGKPRHSTSDVHVRGRVEILVEYCSCQPS